MNKTNRCIQSRNRCYALCYNKSIRKSKQRKLFHILMSYGQIIAAIQCYIHHMTDKEVQINLPRNIGEIKKMQQMYNIASAYLS
jgi:hypothetical protein